MDKISNYQYPPWGTLYDILNSDYIIDKDYYVSLFHRTDGNILELGCGTGRISFELARRGADITCVDISTPMLNRLRESAKAEQLNIRVIEQDIINLSIDELYSLIIMPFSAFVNVNDQKCQLKVLTNVRNHLKPTGKLCFDIFVPNYEYMIKTNGISYLKKKIKTKEGRILWNIQSKYDFVTQKVQKENVIEMYDNNGVLQKKYCLPHTFRYVTAAELSLMLKLSGYSTYHLFGGFEKQTLDVNSSEIVCEAIR